MTDKLTPQDITPGNSYACHFRVHTFVDDQGRAVSTKNLRPGDSVKGAEPGYYEGFGVIQKRDTARKLLEIWDTELERSWVVSWQDAWAIDQVEWVDQTQD